MTASALLAVSVLVPLAAALVALAVPRRAVRWVGFGGAIATALTIAALVRAIALDGDVEQALGGWAPPLGIVLAGDWLTALLIGVTALVGLLTSLFALIYFEVHDEESVRRGQRFWPLWLLCWSGLTALLLSRDLFNVYVTLELVTLSAVALVALAGGDAFDAALRYLLWALAGSGMYLMGLALIYGQAGTLDFVLLHERLSPGPGAFLAVALALAGLLLKGALFPLHFWLPPAHARAPAPVSAVLSALVVMAAFYLVLRLAGGPFAALVDARTLHVLGVLGVIAVAWGSAQALVQARLKMLVAYSTVAQVGYLYVALALAAPQAGVYLAVSHALAKAALFLSAGAVMHGLGHDRVDSLAGVARSQPVTLFAFGLAGMSLIGLPPSGGFVGKWMLLERALDTQAWLHVAVILGGGLATAGYVFRVLAPCFAPAADAPLRKTPLLLQLVCLALALGAIAMGFTAPLLLREPIDETS